MRPTREELVGAAHEQVGAKCSNVDRQMRTGVHRVDVGQRTDRVRRLDDAPDVSDGAERVRREPDGHDLRPRPQHRVQGVEI